MQTLDRAGGPLGETAVAAGRAQTREGARYRRLARKRGKAKACVAVGNTQLKVYQKLLSNPGMRYEDLGRTTTSAAATCAARSPTTSASSATSASKSLSAASPNLTQTEQPDPDRLTHTAPAGPDRLPWPGPAAARPANLHFSGQSLMALRAAVAA